MKILEVHWEDPTTAIIGWHQLGDIKPKDLKPADCRSVGYLFKETKDEIILVSSENTWTDKEKHEVGEGMVLPRSVIKTIRELK